MKNNKIVADYSLVEGQEIALMPANLAKKLLKMFADKLVNASASEIISQHMDDLRSVMRGASDYKLEDAIALSQEFVNERTLVANIQAENWDAYLVKEEVKQTINE